MKKNLISTLLLSAFAVALFVISCVNPNDVLPKENRVDNLIGDTENLDDALKMEGYTYNIYEDLSELDYINEDNYQEILNDHSIVQIEEVIYKYDEPEGFLYVMEAHDINADHYAQLATSEFNDAVMSKLKINHNYHASIPKFLGENIGYDGTDDPIDVTPTKFWGWGGWHHHLTDVEGEYVTHRHYWSFWMVVYVQVE